MICLRFFRLSYRQSIHFLRYILKIIEISNSLLQRLDKNDFPSLVALPLSSVPCALLIEHRNARGYTMNPLCSYVRVLMKLQRSLFF